MYATILRVTALAFALGFSATAIAQDCNTNGTADSVDVLRPTVYSAAFDGGADSVYLTNGFTAITGGAARLTPDTGPTLGALVFAPINPEPMVSFTASFDIRMGPNTYGGEGMSFAVLQAAHHTPQALFGETGPGAHSLAIEFDTQDDDGAGPVDPSINHIAIRLHGVVIASQNLTLSPGANYRLSNDQWHHVTVAVTAGGALTLVLDHSDYPPLTVFSNQPIGRFLPTARLFGFGARCGAAHNHHWVDNILITSIAPDPATDSDLNGVIDCCEFTPDCNTNGYWDYCEAGWCPLSGSSNPCADCNTNKTLDRCELPGRDCNTSLVPDDCELGGRDCDTNRTLDMCQGDMDCNADSTPDVCNIAGSPSLDCNSNRTLDQCEWTSFTDCDQNNLLDICEQRFLRQSSFSGAGGSAYSLNWDAVISAGAVRLTNQVANSRGSVVFSSPTLDPVSAFRARFSYRRSHSTDRGVSFCMINTVTAGSGYVWDDNLPGPHELAVSIGRQDAVIGATSAVHVYWRNSVLATAPVTIEDNSWYTVRIELSAGAKLSVGFEEGFNEPAPPVILSGHIPAFVPYSAYFGIAARNSQQGEVANHFVDEFDIESTSQRLDCNGNGVNDQCEIHAIADCNTDGTFDVCDVANDCNSNDRIDVCEPQVLDCNSNGTLDICEPSLTAYQADFSDGSDSPVVFNGDAQTSAGVVRLAREDGGRIGSMIFAEKSNGRVTGFSARFSYLVESGPNVFFTPNIALELLDQAVYGLNALWGGEGPFGGSEVGVGMDEYATPYGAPRTYVAVNGAIVFHAQTPVTSTAPGWRTIQVDYVDRLITIRHGIGYDIANPPVVFANVFVPLDAPLAGRFGIGGRSPPISGGGLVIDAVRIVAVRGFADCDADGIPDPCDSFPVNVAAGATSSVQLGCAYPCPLEPGDLNADGAVDADDIAAMVASVVSGISINCSDLDRDGAPAALDADDVAVFTTRLLLPAAAPAGP